MAVKKSKKLKALVIIIVILLLVAVTAVYGIYGTSVPVSATIVDSGRVERLIQETGTVKPETLTTIMANKSGEVQQIYVSEGDRVEVGQILFSGKAVAGAGSQIQSLKAELAALQIQYNQLREAADRNKALYEHGALSLEAYNQSVAASEQIAAQVTALSHSITSYTESSGAPEARSPMAGVITDVFVQKGQVILAGTPLFEVSDLESLYIEVDLAAEDADLVQLGNLARIINNKTDFLDDKGKVRKIHPKAQDKISELGISQKRVTVEVALSAPVSIRIGSTLDVEIIVEQKDGVIRVEPNALFEMKQQDYVFVIADGKALLRQIEKGLEGEDFTEILSGLKKGEKVILSPGNEVEDGIRVREE